MVSMRTGRMLCRLPLLSALFWSSWAQAGDPPAPGQPPITPQTARSGGPVDGDQAKLAFDRAALAFEIFPDRHALAATAALTFTARQPVDRLRLDLDANYTVRAISIDGRPVAASDWRNPDGRLDIALRRPLAAGETVTATIAYAGTPHVAVRAPWDDGVVWARTPDGRPWIATTDEGYGCDLFWPCLDFPTGEPKLLDLAVTVPPGLSAPANGRLVTVDRHADGRTTWRWHARQPNSYAVALNVGPFEQLDGHYRSRFGNIIPLAFWHLPGKAPQARALFAEFAPMLDFFETMLGPYPFGDEKMGVVETPYLGMEHQTIIAYGNGYRGAPEGFDWLLQHEFAHEWFGNQMTAADWDDYWLHEGFGQYMQPLYGRWREGEARYAAMMATQRALITNRAPLVSGRARTEEEVYEPANGGPGSDLYSKGAWVLHTLRWLVGDAAFWDATRRLVYGRPDPLPGNFTPRFGTTDEFIALVDTAAGRDLGWFFDVYLREAALPDLVETRHGDRLTLTWKAPSGRPFPMPVEVEIDGTIRRIELPGGTATLTVPVDAHVILDPNARILRRSEAIERTQASATGN